MVSNVTAGCRDGSLLDFLLPDGVGPDDDDACCSPDLDLALEGFTDASRGGLTVISCVDPDGAPVNPGA